MAAGLGFKTFTTGEVLTSADVNGYLMQGVLVFASTAARDAAITSPQEGQFAFTKDTDQLWYRSSSAWVASGATGDIEGVTAGTGISGGGTSGTVTVSIDTAVTVDKTTAQTLTNKTLTSPALTTPTISTATTNGDILYGTGSGALARLGIGSTAQVLTVASGIPSWATPATSGFVGVSLYHSGGSITVANATDVTLSFTAAEEQFDTDAFHTGTSALITIPAGKGGYYLISGGIKWPANASNRRVMTLWKNGVSTGTNLFNVETTSGATYYPTTYGAFVVPLAVADTVSIGVYQDSGGSITCEKSLLQAYYLGA